MDEPSYINGVLILTTLMSEIHYAACSLESNCSTDTEEATGESLNDLLYKFNFIARIYFVYQDLNTSVEFESIFSKHWMKYESHEFTSFNSLETGVSLRTDNLLIIYYCTEDFLKLICKMH